MDKLLKKSHPKCVASSTAKELEAMRKAVDHLKKHPEKVRKLAIEMGIHTRTGRLSKTYGG